MASNLTSIALFGGLKTLAKSATATTGRITLTGPEGYFSLQVTLTGSGTGKFEVLYSNDDVTYVTPTGVSDVVTALTVGTDIYQIDNGLYKFMKIKVTETGGVNPITFLATLCVQ